MLRFGPILAFQWKCSHIGLCRFSYLQMRNVIQEQHNKQTYSHLERHHKDVHMKLDSFSRALPVSSGFVFKDMRPLSVVEGDGFHQLLTNSELSSYYYILHRVTLFSLFWTIGRCMCLYCAESFVDTYLHMV